jgi:hypothetical protein
MQPRIRGRRVQQSLFPENPSREIEPTGASRTLVEALADLLLEVAKEQARDEEGSDAPEDHA